MGRERSSGAELPGGSPTALDAALRREATRSVDRTEALVPLVVDALDGVGPWLDPTAASRQRMRARVLTAEPDLPRTLTAPPDRPEPTRPAAGARRRPRWSGPVAAALALLLGLGVVAGSARDARPGEALFGVRSAGEQAVVALSAVGGSRSGAELHVADARLADLTAVVSDPASAPGDARAGVDELLGHLRTGSSLALERAVAGDTAALVVLHDWASQRSWAVAAGRAGRTPARSTEVRRVATALLSVIARTEGIALRLTCRQITEGADDLGPLPATGPCHPVDPSTGLVVGPVVDPLPVDQLPGGR